MPYDPRIELSKEREDLKRRVKDAHVNDVKDFLMKQLNDVEDAIDDALRQESSD